MATYATAEKFFFQPHLIIKSTDCSSLQTRQCGGKEIQLQVEEVDVDRRSAVEVGNNVRQLRKLLREQTNLPIRSLQVRKDLKEQATNGTAQANNQHETVAADDALGGEHLPDVVKDSDVQHVDNSKQSKLSIRENSMPLDKVTTTKTQSNGLFTTMSRRQHTYSSNPNLGCHKQIKRSHTLGLGEKNSWKVRSVPTQLNLVAMSANGNPQGEGHLPEMKNIDVFTDDMCLSDSYVYARQASGGEKKKQPSPIQEDQDEEDALRLESESMQDQVEREVKSNWLLDEELKNARKLFERREQALKIVLPDEDAMEVIEQRMSEIRHMSKPRRDERHVLDRMPSPLRDSVVVSSVVFKSKFRIF